MTANQDYDTEVASAEVAYNNAIYTQQALAFASLDVAVGTDYSGYLAGLAATYDSWWTTTGNLLYTNYHTDLATNNYNEEFTVAGLSYSRETSLVSTTAARAAAERSAYSNRFLSSMADSRDMQISSAGDVFNYQSSLATARQGQAVTGDLGAFNTESNSASDTFGIGVVANRGAAASNAAGVNVDFVADYQGVLDINGNAVLTGSIAEQAMTA